MTYKEHMDEEYNRGLKVGREEGREEGMEKGMEKGKISGRVIKIYPIKWTL